MKHMQQQITARNAVLIGLIKNVINDHKCHMVDRLLVLLDGNPGLLELAHQAMPC